MSIPLSTLWKEVENRYGLWHNMVTQHAIQFEKLIPPRPGFPWNDLYQNLLAMKEQVERQQILARLGLQPTFLNYSDKIWEEHGDDAKKIAIMAQHVCQRFPALLWHASYYGAMDPSNMPLCPLDPLDIISKSRIAEWPLDLGKGESWDRAPLYFQAKKVEQGPKRSTQRAKTKQSSADGEQNGDENHSNDAQQGKAQQGHIYQLRFLAFEDYHTTSPVFAEVHHSLQVKKSPQIVGEIQDSERAQSKAYYLKQFNGETLQTTVLRADNIKYRRLNIPLNNVSFFVAPRQTMGQANSFTIESQVFVWTEWGGVVISSDESPCFDLYAEYAQKINMSTVKFNYKPSIFSHSFFLQSNAAKQEYDHYFPAAWRVIHEYFKYPESFDDLDNKLDNATLTLQQTLIWLKGIVPAMCTRKCRVLDDKEIKYVCRLLLIKKICRAAGYEVTEAKHSNKMTDRQRILKNEKKVERNKEWTKKREQKDQAIELERLIFGGEIVPEEDRASPRLWVHAMVKALISWKKPFPNDLPIEAKDLKDRRHIVNKYWETPVPEEMEIRPTDSSIIIWLMHIGKAVEDFNENLCQKDSPKPTIELWNERFITLRSPERCRQNVLDFSNQAVIPALLLSFDDGHLDHLLIHFTRFYNNKDVHFGRIPISLIGQLRKWAIVKEKQTEEVRGLRAFFCQGYPSNFRHILQAGSLRIGDGTSAFLYKSDALPNDNQLAVSKAIFESRPTIVNENHEIDPLFGKPRIMPFPSPNPIFIQEPEFSKLTITDPKKDTSQDLIHKIPVPNHPKPEIVEPTSPNQSYPVNMINPQVSPAYPNVYVAPPTGYHPHHPTPVQQLAGYSPIASFQQSPPFINYPSNQFQYLPYEWTVPAAPNYPGYLQPSPAPQSNHSAQSSGEYLDPQNRNGQLGYQSPPSVYHSPPSAYQSPNAFDANMIPGDLSPRNQTLF